MFKTSDGVIYWQAGDKALVSYFGNDESRYGTDCIVDVLGVVDDNPANWRRATTGMISIRLHDTVGNSDENGEPRTYFDAVRWSTELTEG